MWPLTGLKTLPADNSPSVIVEPAESDKHSMNRPTIIFLHPLSLAGCVLLSRQSLSMASCPPTMSLTHMVAL